MRVPEPSCSRRSTSKPSRERSLELLAAVALVHLLALGGEQARDHRVVAVGELDHEPRVEAPQPARRAPRTGTLRPIARWWTSARQRTRSGRPRSSSRRRSTPRQPRAGEASARSTTSGRIVFEPSARSARVELADDPLVAVDRDHVLGVQRAREAAVVRAEVPGEPRGAGLAHEALLALGVLVAVRRRLAVAGPLGAPALRRQPLDELAQPPDVRLDQLLLEAGGLQLGADVALARSACLASSRSCRTTCVSTPRRKRGRSARAWLGSIPSRLPRSSGCGATPR